MGVWQQMFGYKSLQEQTIEADNSEFVHDHTQMTDIKGTTVRTVVAPANVGNAPTLLFVDGLRLQLTLFEPQLEYCREFANILALDLPGASDSKDMHNNDYSTTSVVNFLDEWLSTKPFGQETPIFIVATGLAASIALSLAAWLDTRCKGCILISTPQAGADQDFTRLQSSLNYTPVWAFDYIRSRSSDPARGSRKMLSAGNQDNAQLLDRLRIANRRLRSGPFLEYIRKLDPMTSASAGAINVPVLIIEGQESDTARTAQVWQKWLPNSSLETVPDAKTAVTLEQPLIVNEYIKAFVTSHS